MKGKEFITMMRQDIETHQNKELLSEVVNVMEAVVNLQPFAEIDPTGKTPEGCYSAMENHARQNKKENSFVFSPKYAMDFVAKYLGLKATQNTSENSTPTVGIVNLEEFL